MERLREDEVTQNSISLDFSQLPGQDPDLHALEYISTRIWSVPLIPFLDQEAGAHER